MFRFQIILVLALFSTIAMSQVVINGKTYNEQEVAELESYIGEPIKAGNYWYDGEFWGYQGDEVGQQKFAVPPEIMQQHTVKQIISDYPQQ